MSVVFNNILAGSSGQGGAAAFEIERSLRFNSADSASLSRTPSSAGNRKTWTWSGWVKRSAVGTKQIFFGVQGTSDTTYVENYFATDDKLYLRYGYNSVAEVRTTQVFRDVSAWMHIVIAFDVTQSSDTDKLRLYINGSQVDDFSTDTRSSFSNQDYGINRAGAHKISGAPNGSSDYLDAYLADVHFIDGQALAPTEFGETDTNGVWQPKVFVPSSPNNDTTWSNNVTGANNATNGFNGNLSDELVSSSAGGTITFTASFSGVSTFRYYTSNSSAHTVGFNGGAGVNDGGGAGWRTVTPPSSISSIEITHTNSGATAQFAAIQINSVTLIDGVGQYGRNGFHLPFSDNSSNAALGTDTSGNSNTWTVNNLVATAGLETSNEGFDIVNYSGNGTARSIGGLSFQPDFVWTKLRNTGNNHKLFDSVRGVEKRLESSTTNAEATESGTLTAFNSDGFSLGTSGNTNGTGYDYVAWCWKAGGAAVSNTDGTITSSVSVNTSYGFSIASYTGTGSTATWGHGLNSAPELVIVKSRSDAQNWAVYSKHTSGSASPAEEYGFLNSTNAFSSSGAGFFWNNTLPTSSVVTVGSDNTVNGSSKTYIAYCWSEVSGFSKFGSYTGNGSATGPVVTTDFKPKFVLIKESSAAGQSWQLHDAARGGNKYLQANSSAAESTFTSVEFNNSGFSIKTSDNGWNRSGGTYIYAAFADKPPGEIIDSLIDTPTDIEANSGNNPGNYCTLNPLKKANITTSNGNLDFTHSGSTGNWQVVFSTIGMSSGKYYCEFTCKDSDSIIGIAKDSHTIANDKYVGNDPNGWGYNGQNGTTFNNSSSSSYGSSYTSGDVIGIAFDADGGNLYFYKNGVVQNSGTAAYTGLTDGPYFFAFSLRDTGNTPSVNFGQRPFAISSIPTGYKSLCTSNLPDPTISDPSQYFDAKLYTGNASSNTISGLNFAPDFLWLKSRGSAQSHALFDLVRGSGQRLQSNATSAEDDYSSFFTGFTSDGFTLNQNSGINLNNDPLVAWAWDAGTSTVTNNDGSIASQVRAQPSAGFSVVSFTASGTAGSDSCGHGLNVVPGMVIIKRRDGADDWYTWHSSFSNAQRNYILLNSTAAVVLSGNDSWGAGMTSSVIGFRSQGTAAGNMIAYCFAPVEGYSAFGSYTGNASADGTFVYTGFRPSFVMHKRTDTGGASVGDWRIWDTKRDTDNAAEALLFPAGSNAESSNSAHGLDILSNGFKFRTADTNINANGGSYLYIAFAENPFKTARAR